jgi:LmbE family N-acetylglucosaminyl deacetylase
VKILVLQPHYDDAVWSIAEHMLTWLKAGDHVGVCTVFGWTGAPKEDLLAVEHAQAMSLMRMDEAWALDFRDDAHRDRGLTRSDVARAMAAQVEHWKPDVAVVPMGIHHPDHRMCAMTAWDHRRVPTWRYEELPYYVLYPSQCVTDDDARGVGWHLRKNDDFLPFKKALCQIYASQWAPHLERTVYAPERLWGTA